MVAPRRNPLEESHVMNINIIGTGHIGKLLARGWARHGHTVYISNSRGAQTLVEFASKIGAHACNAGEHLADADVIVVSVPQCRVPTLPEGLLESARADAIVIDTGNYYPRHRDGKIAQIEEGMLESVWVARHLKRPVIKVFNNIYAAHLDQMARPQGAGDRVALPVSGDDARAKAVVFGLVDQMGFDAVDAGPLSESWRQQPGSPVYVADFNEAAVQLALKSARRERSPDWKATPNSPGTFDQPT
jgi:predicted dinucleotide-binding enzyme